MKTTFPQTKNPLASLQEFVVRPADFSQILDFGRYTVRVDPQAGRGWFKSEISVGQFTGTIHIDQQRVVSVSAELPPQVRIALERAGYVL